MSDKNILLPSSSSSRHSASVTAHPNFSDLLLFPKVGSSGESENRVPDCPDPDVSCLPLYTGDNHYTSSLGMLPRLPSCRHTQTFIKHLSEEKHLQGTNSFGISIMCQVLHHRLRIDKNRI